MIQFKRGKSASWQSQATPLADGQPGYDKDRRKIKIGDGKSSWKDLPYASGLFADEILDSEKEAKIKTKAKAALNPLAGLVSKVFNLEDRPIITYGTEAPDEDTVGRIYLQHYESAPEVDYVVEFGFNNGWYYRKWKSGRAECYGTLDVSTIIQETVGSVYRDCNVINKLEYPFTFSGVPQEIATIQTPGNIVWIASKEKNTESQSAVYTIISADKQATAATYTISISVSGFYE